MEEATRITYKHIHNFVIPYTHTQKTHLYLCIPLLFIPQNPQKIKTKQG